MVLIGNPFVVYYQVKARFDSAMPVAAAILIGIQMSITVLSQYEYGTTSLPSRCNCRYFSPSGLAWDYHGKPEQGEVTRQFII